MKALGEILGDPKRTPTSTSSIADTTSVEVAPERDPRVCPICDGARFVRVTPQKARRVIDLIRGMKAMDAQAVLAFAPQAASEPVGKVLASAIANATNNHAMDARSLVVHEAGFGAPPTVRAEERILDEPGAAELLQVDLALASTGGA